MSATQPRIKTGIKGFLIHVATNGLLFVGVGVVLFWLHPSLGLILAVAGILLAAMTHVAAAAIHGRAARYREKEGELAEAIHQSSSLDSGEASFVTLNRSSGRHEAALTVLQGRATWGAHGLFGATVLVSVWVCWRAALAGNLDADGLVLLALYALTLRAPMVQLVRQGCRTGKILAGVDRLVLFLGDAAFADEQQPALRPLVDSLSLHAVKIRARRNGGKHRRLGPIDLDIPAGQHIALLGGRAAGKTTLLRILAGLETDWTGSVTWDGRRTSLLNPLPAACAFLPDSPDWTRVSLRDYLRVSGDTRDAFTSRVFALCDVDKLVGRLPRGLDTELRGEALSHGERHTLTLARTLRSKASVMLLDDPFAKHRARKREGLLASILEIADRSTVVVALSRPTDLSAFDRVVELKRGRIVFDGAPDIWRDRRASKDASGGPTSLPVELTPHATRDVRS